MSLAEHPQALKHAYLHAMGVPIWVARGRERQPLAEPPPSTAPPSAPRQAPPATEPPASPERDKGPMRSAQSRAAEILASLAEAQTAAKKNTPAPAAVETSAATEPEPGRAAEPEPQAPRLRPGDYPHLHWLDPESLLYQLSHQRLLQLSNGQCYTHPPDNGLCVVCEPPLSEQPLDRDEAAMQLLAKMLEAMGQDIGRTAVAQLAARADAEDASAHTVVDLLRQQSPRALLLMARIDFRYRAQSINHLRQQWMQVPTTAVPMLVSHHPSYLLQNPAAKRQAWDDLKHLRQFLIA